MFFKKKILKEKKYENTDVTDVINKNTNIENNKEKKEKFSFIKSRYKIDFSVTKDAISDFKKIFTSNKIKDDTEELKNSNYDFLVLLEKWKIIDNKDENLSKEDLELIINESLLLLDKYKRKTLIIIGIIFLFFLLPQIYILLNNFSIINLFGTISITIVLFSLFIKYLSLLWRKDVLQKKKFILFFNWLKEYRYA